MKNNILSCGLVDNISITCHSQFFLCVWGGGGLPKNVFDLLNQLHGFIQDLVCVIVRRALRLIYNP